MAASPCLDRTPQHARQAGRVGTIRALRHRPAHRCRGWHRGARQTPALALARFLGPKSARLQRKGASLAAILAARDPPQPSIQEIAEWPMAAKSGSGKSGRWIAAKRPVHALFEGRSRQLLDPAVHSSAGIFRRASIPGSKHRQRAAGDSGAGQVRRVPAASLECRGAKCRDATGLEALLDRSRGSRSIRRRERGESHRPAPPPGRGRNGARRIQLLAGRHALECRGNRAGGSDHSFGSGGARRSYAGPQSPEIRLGGRYLFGHFASVGSVTFLLGSEIGGMFLACGAALISWNLIEKRALALKTFFPYTDGKVVEPALRDAVSGGS